MLAIEPTGAVLGAVARGIDLAEPLREREMGAVLLALGRYGVLRFPDQHLGLGELKRFSARSAVLLEVREDVDLGTRRLRGAAGRDDQDAARRHDRDAQHREILGAHAAGP
jgi:alpha-ketoglutarate-dependent taurine dioxygenase